MRAVMDLGGFCASGGPYEIAVECPDAVIATTPLSILGGFLAAGLIIWGAAGLPGAWMSLVFLAWPALFLSLGWNFLEYGFFPPEGGWVWSWLFCGVLFVLMGAVPLVIGDRRLPRGGRRRPRLRLGPGGGPAAAESARGCDRHRSRARSPLRRPRRSWQTTMRWWTGSSVWRRCAAGATSRPAEYETAKAATLAEAGGRRMNGSFQPVWLRVAVILAAIAGVLVAVWLFALLATSGG